MSLLLGSRVGSYEIISLLGAGGMGEVYRARDKKLDREVAIKVLPESLAADPAAMARFEREAKAVAALSHPNILAIHDFGTHHGVAYAVMELLEGTTLRERLNAEQIPLKQAVAFALQMAKGLSTAHEKGIVHRDLKPENIFIGKDGHLKILDFGLAKRVEPTSSGADTNASTASAHTEPGAVMGTVGYMSPEQVRGLAIDHRSDIFSFGAILYEMLSGKRAFKRDSSADTMSAILRDEPPELSESGRSIPLALDQVVRHCLEKSADQRFQSGRDLAFALESLSFQATAQPATSSPVKQRVSGRLWLVVAAIAILAVAGILLVRSRTVSPPASIAVLPFANISDEKDQEYFSDGLSEELIDLLTKVKELRVVGRMSSFAFKGKNESLASIGQNLHVGTVLEGSVRRAGDRLRVSARLVKVADGVQLWAETYDRKITDVFAMQDEIAGAVVAALKVKLLPRERLPSSQHRTSNPEAYNQFLLGRQFHNRVNQDGYRRAAAAYERAIELDPAYAAAFAGLSHSLAQLGDFTQSPAEQAEIQKKAIWAAEQAVALDPALGESYAARANVRTYITRDWRGAQEDFDRAFSLDPRDARTNYLYGRLQARLGRLPEAIAACRKATEIDPLWAAGMAPYGSFLSANGQLLEARKVLTRSLEISPESEWGRYFLGITMLLEGKPEEALALCTPAGTVLRKTIVALAEIDLGHRVEAQRALDQLIAEHSQTSAFRVALVYARRGERDRAFEWLERALLQHDSQLSTLKINPILAPLRDDPRFAEILKKLNLPVGN